MLVKRTELVDKHKIKVKEQARKEFDKAELLRLAESMLVEQLQPIGLTPDYLLCWGERRWRAAMLHDKITHLWAVFLDTPMTESEFRVLQLTENLCREDLKAAEKIQGIAGCMVYLTQSLHSYYSALKGRNGEHQTDAFLTNFGTKIFHQVGDAKTAEYGASLIGKSLQRLVGNSMGPTGDVWQELIGQSKITTNTSEHMDYIVQPRQFLTGLRTGGPHNDYCADAIVIRSEPFADGRNFKFVAFSQR